MAAHYYIEERVANELLAPVLNEYVHFRAGVQLKPSKQVGLNRTKLSLTYISTQENYYLSPNEPLHLIVYYLVKIKLPLTAC